MMLIWMTIKTINGCLRVIESGNILSIVAKNPTMGKEKYFICTENLANRLRFVLG